MKLAVDLTRSTPEICQRFRALSSRSDLAELLEVSAGHLTYILYGPAKNRSYRNFEIAKRGGGTRDISAPPPSLQILQAKFNDVLQRCYDVKPGVEGFVRGGSIVTNAVHHAGKRHVLNVDLADYFPSINFGRVRGLFRHKPFDFNNEVASTIARLCCDNDSGLLPQGAPSSPMIANLASSHLDTRLRALAKRHRCSYSRYADDITFSTNEIDFPPELAQRQAKWLGSDTVVGDELKAAVESSWFSVNPTKVRLQSRRSRQEVTGLIVNRFPNVRRRFVRQIRAMLHAWEKYGYDAAEAEYRTKYDDRSRRPGAPLPSFRQVVRGKIEFVRMVRTSANGTFRALANRLHRLDPDAIRWYPLAYSGVGGLWTHWHTQYNDLIFLTETKLAAKPLGGTAFVWHGNVIATAAHVLAGTASVTLYLPDGRSVAVGDRNVHHGAPGVDAGLAAIPETFRRSIPIRQTELKKGERVAAFAFAQIPWRDVDKVAGIYEGIVESHAPLYGGAVDTIQVTIEIAGGMSGAPVIDEEGLLVGITIEDTFEDTAEDVPPRKYRHVLPIRYLLDIASPK